MFLVSSLPCEIDHDGQAPVDEYFIPENTGEASWPLKVSFRGRPWKGCKCTLKNGCHGFILRLEKSQFQVVGSFQEICHYEWDQLDTAGSVGGYSMLGELIEFAELLERTGD